MPLYRDEGIVLRTQKLGETDRIITLLTREHGLIRAVAKGVRRTSSRFGGRLEPFCIVELQCYEGRTLDTITQAESVAMYGPAISADIDKYFAANTMVETAERLATHDAPGSQYHLLYGALRSLAQDRAPRELVRDGYLLRALGLAGWAPGLDRCVVCGVPGPHQHVMIGVGGAVCASCKQAGAIHVRADTMTLLDALLSGDWETALASEERTRNEASGFTTAYVQWHLERGLKSAGVQRAPRPARAQNRR